MHKEAGRRLRMTETPVSGKDISLSLSSLSLSHSLSHSLTLSVCTSRLLLPISLKNKYDRPLIWQIHHIPLLSRILFPPPWPPQQDSPFFAKFISFFCRPKPIRSDLAARTRMFAILFLPFSRREGKKNKMGITPENLCFSLKVPTDNLWQILFLAAFFPCVAGFRLMLWTFLLLECGEWKRT